MVDQPGIEPRALRIHGKPGSKEHKLNVPAPWHQAMNKADVPSLLVRQAGAEPAIVMNVEEKALGKWAWDVAGQLYQGSGQWSAGRASALARRVERAMAGIEPPPLDPGTLRVDAARARIRARVPAPLARAHRAALDSICAGLGLEWSVPFDEAAPAIELVPVDPADNVITRSDAEEAKAATISRATVPTPTADDLLGIYDGIVRAFRDDWERYTAAVRAAAARFGIQVHFRGTMPEFALPGGSKPAPFVAFKQATLACMPLASWLELEKAFRVSSAGYELDMVPCIAIDLCLDGFRAALAAVPRKGIAEQRAARGIVPLAPDPARDLLDGVVAEIERLAASGIPRKTWSRGYPPPAFPDRLDEVPPLNCARCGADITAAAYGHPEFVRTVKCEACGASSDVTFSRGEYAVAGPHREKKASR